MFKMKWQEGLQKMPLGTGEFSELNKGGPGLSPDSDKYSSNNCTREQVFC